MVSKNPHRKFRGHLDVTFVDAISEIAKTQTTYMPTERLRTAKSCLSSPRTVLIAFKNSSQKRRESLKLASSGTAFHDGVKSSNLCGND